MKTGERNAQTHNTSQQQHTETGHCDGFCIDVFVFTKHESKQQLQNITTTIKKPPNVAQSNIYQN